MGKNVLYANEIATANKFVLENSGDVALMNFLKSLKSSSLIHSDRWSLIYDYLKENYPGTTGAVVTGLSYWVEG